MRRIRRWFSMLFIASALLGAMHEIIHHHHHDLQGHYEESCPLYLLTQTPALPTDSFPLAVVTFAFEPFISPTYFAKVSSPISLRNRAPPAA